MGTVKRNLPLLLLLALLGAAALWIALDSADDGATEDSTDRLTAPAEGEGPTAAPEAPAAPQDREASRAAVPEAGGPLRLVARKPDGRLAEETEFFVYDGRGRGRIVTAPAGRAGIESSGHRLVVAARSDGLWSELRTLEGEALSKPRELEFSIVEPAAELAVKVRAPGGRPLAEFEAEIHFAGVEGSGFAAEFSLPDLYRRCAGEAEGRDGRAEFHGLPAGTYSVRVQTAEAATATATAVVEPGARESLELDLRPGASVVGRLVDEQGAPLSGDARVYLRDTESRIGVPDMLPPEYWYETAPEGHRTEMGPDGRFRIGPAAEGRYRIGVKAEGRPNLFFDTEHELLPGQKLEVGDLYVPAGAGLVVFVYEQRSMEPVEGARIRHATPAQRESFLGPILERRRDLPETDPDGMASLTGLPSGELVVRAEAEGFAPSETTVELAERGRQTVQLMLAEELVITGTVIDGKTKAPVAGARVRARQQESKSFMESFIPEEALPERDRTDKTGAEGRFRIGQLEAGDWLVSVRAEGYAGAIEGPVRLEYGAPAPDLSIALRGGATLVVRVLDADGEPRAGVNLSVFSMVTQDARNETTGETGEFTFENLIPGQYMVTSVSLSMEQQFEMMGSGGDLEGFEQELTTVELEEDEVEELVLGGIVERSKIEGFVTLEGVPKEEISVMLTSGSFNKVSTSEEDGYYSFDAIPSGSYLIMAGDFSPGSGTLWMSGLEVRGAEVLRYDIDLPNRVVTVKVVEDASGEPIARVPVMLRRLDGTQGGGGFLSTDSKGLAEFVYLEPGDYAITAGSAAMPFFGTGGDHATTVVSPIHLTEESRADSLIEIRLAEAATLAGRVLDNRGEPLSEVGVFLLDEGGQPITLFDLRGTDGEGRFELKSLPPGKARVLARHRKYGQIEQEVWLRSGETTEMDLTLDTGTLVHVLITDARDEPRSGIQAVLLDSRGAPISQLFTGMESMMAGMAFLKGGPQTLGPVPPGKYTVLLSVPGKAQERHELEIAPGTPELHLTYEFDGS